jgi:hypothetical protein
MAIGHLQNFMSSCAEWSEPALDAWISDVPNMSPGSPVYQQCLSFLGNLSDIVSQSGSLPPADPASFDFLYSTALPKFFQFFRTQPAPGWRHFATILSLLSAARLKQHRLDFLGALIDLLAAADSLAGSSARFPATITRESANPNARFAIETIHSYPLYRWLIEEVAAMKSFSGLPPVCEFFKLCLPHFSSEFRSVLAASFWSCRFAKDDVRFASSPESLRLTRLMLELGQDTELNAEFECLHLHNAFAFLAKGVPASTEIDFVAKLPNVKRLLASMKDGIPKPVVDQIFKQMPLGAATVGFLLAVFECRRDAAFEDAIDF